MFVALAPPAYFLAQPLLFWSQPSRVTRITAHISKPLASQAFVPLKYSTILLIDAGASTRGAIDGAFLITKFTGRNAGLDLGRVFLAATAAAGLPFVAAKEPPKELYLVLARRDGSSRGRKGRHGGREEGGWGSCCCWEEESQGKAGKHQQEDP